MEQQTIAITTLFTEFYYWVMIVLMFLIKVHEGILPWSRQGTPATLSSGSDQSSQGNPTPWGR